MDYTSQCFNLLRTQLHLPTAPPTTTSTPDTSSFFLAIHKLSARLQSFILHLTQLHPLYVKPFKSQLVFPPLSSLPPTYPGEEDEDFVGRLITFCKTHSASSLTPQCVQQLDQYFTTFINTFTTTIKTMLKTLEVQQNSLSKPSNIGVSAQALEHRKLIVLSLEGQLTRCGELVLAMTTERRANTTLTTNIHIGQFYKLNTNIDDLVTTHKPHTPASVADMRKKSGKSVHFDEIEGKSRNNASTAMLDELSFLGVTDQALLEDKKDIVNDMDQEELKLAASLESTIQQINSLMNTLQTHITEQSQTIQRIHQDVEATYENVGCGNVQLEDAIAKEACAPWFYATVFLSMSAVVFIFDFAW